MDPLSISASIIGITTAAVQISRLLKTFIDGANGASTSARGVLMEVTGIYVCLHQLQGFLIGNEETAKSRRSLIMIEQVIVVFTDCVSVFSELEQTLESLKTSEHMCFIDRVKWASKESAISKLLSRLQASKTSLNFMLTILTCTSMDWAEASTRNLTSLVQEVLKTNVNMASRLKNLERMHPALAASLCTSQNDIARSEGSESRASSRRTYYRFTFEEELETSLVYKRAGLNHIRFSKSSTSSNGPSYLSGLSLSDVSNVSAIALPISSMELWNHHRYTPDNAGSATTATSLDAWYNPSAKKSAFIRTAYFNGQYTNQYAQSKFTGHLIYRRFTITTPQSSPVFTEGAIMPQSPKELERIGEEASEKDERFELEDTAIENAPPELEGGQIALRSALNMDACDLHAIASLPEGPTPDTALHSAPRKALPLSSPETWKGRMTLAARRRRVRSTSPSIKLTKPLAGMGDSLHWKLSVLHKFNDIQYTL
ncbi:MAG: hypothetical protein Q9175_005164 [Cornicularia normoerica]